MDSCFEFGDSRTSVNKSWICLKNDGTGAGDDCFFLLQQQLDRSSSHCGTIEAGIMIFLCLACYPANVFAIRNFAKQQIKREFLFLSTVVAFCNVCLASIGILQGISRSSEDWLFGIYGCAATIPGPGFFTTLKLWTMTVISFERYLSISNKKLPQSSHYQQSNIINAAKSQQPSRFGCFLSVIVLLLILNCSLWIYPFNYIEVLQINFLRQDENDNNNNNNHIRPINVCGLMTFKMPAGESLTKAAFAVATFCIPLVLSIINYMRIGITMNQRPQLVPAIQKSGSNSTNLLLNTGSPKETKIISSKRLFNSKNRHEAYIAALTLISMIEFFLCTLPSQIAAGYIRYDNDPQRRTLQSSVLFVAHCLLLVNAITNPLTESLLINRRVKKHCSPSCSSPSALFLKKLRKASGQKRLSCHEINLQTMTQHLQPLKKQEPLYEDLSNHGSDYFIDVENSASPVVLVKKVCFRI